MPPKTGDKVTIETKDTSYTGILMPSATNSTVVKLDSGYNIGIDKHKIKKIKVTEKYTEKREKTKSQNKKLTTSKKPKIVILHTGGTIASKIDYRTGAVVARFSPEEIVAMYPELTEHADIESRLISNILSENLRFVHMENIAKEIQKELQKPIKGIIITHGTDTMTYCTAGMSFMVQNPPIPIIFVGAQRSSDRGSSDAPINLLSAVHFIINSDFKGIAICMHHTSDDKQCAILPAAATRKMHSSRRDAFRAINKKPYALVDFPSGKVNVISPWNNSNKPCSIKPTLHQKIGLIKCHPNMHPEIFKAYSGYKGLIIEGTGLGHAPIEDIKGGGTSNSQIKKEIAALIKGGTVVAMTTQTIYGAVQMHVYSPGRALLDLGVIQAKMLPEVAFMKLAWLLKNAKKQEIAQFMDIDLAGELCYKIEDDTFLK